MACSQVSTGGRGLQPSEYGGGGRGLQPSEYGGAWPAGLQQGKIRRTDDTTGSSSALSATKLAISQNLIFKSRNYLSIYMLLCY